MEQAPPEDKPWLANEDSCRQLMQLSESKRTRGVFPGRHRWFPTTVRDPRSGEIFDTESAWSYIHELLTAGAEVEQVVLDEPPGKTGFVIFGRCHLGQKIYIKLQFGQSRVFGRSFHIEDPKGTDR